MVMSSRRHGLPTSLGLGPAEPRRTRHCLFSCLRVPARAPRQCWALGAADAVERQVGRVTTVSNQTSRLVWASVAGTMHHDTCACMYPHLHPKPSPHNGQKDLSRPPNESTHAHPPAPQAAHLDRRGSRVLLKSVFSIASSCAALAPPAAARPRRAPLGPADGPVPSPMIVGVSVGCFVKQVSQTSKRVKDDR